MATFPLFLLVCSVDCQQQAGLSAWVPFHESASAVTQLYRGMWIHRSVVPIIEFSNFGMWSSARDVGVTQLLSNRRQVICLDFDLM